METREQLNLYLFLMKFFAKTRSFLFSITVFLTGVSLTTNGYAQEATKSPEAQAKALLERISGVRVRPQHELIAPMAERIRSGDLLGAAAIATNHPDFLNVTVKHMALSMSTREETLRTVLNDFASLRKQPLLGNKCPSLDFSS